MFDRLEQARLEEIHFRYDASSRLHAIIAVHNTRLGPALGGCRFLAYRTDDDAIDDVVRLARGMSYKAALARVPHGGGKAVIVKPSEPFDRPALFRAFGRFVDRLGGRFITTLDSGSSLADMDDVARSTRFVVGSAADGIDPSPMTALGVMTGIRAALRLGRDDASLAGVRVALQGVGHVGMALLKLLTEADAQVVVADSDPGRTRDCCETFGCAAVDVSEVHATLCDIFAPCALGGVLNEKTIPALRCKIVAGSANNQLASGRDGDLLHRRGILYAPDYVINAGGLIAVAMGYRGLGLPNIVASVRSIGQTLTEVFDRSAAEDCPTYRVADRMAETVLYGGLSGSGG